MLSEAKPAWKPDIREAEGKSGRHLKKAEWFKSPRLFSYGLPRFQRRFISSAIFAFMALFLSES